MKISLSHTAFFSALILIAHASCNPANSKESETSFIDTPTAQDPILNNFTMQVAGDTLYVVDFYTTWCTPCKLMEPDLKRALSEVGGKTKLISLDAEANPALSNYYKIEGYPTLVLIRKGQIIEKLLGRKSYDYLYSKFTSLTTN